MAAAETRRGRNAIAHQPGSCSAHGGASIPLIDFGTGQLQGAEAYDGDERIEENLDILDFDLTAQNLRRLNAMVS
jgi:hypothetical protein